MKILVRLMILFGLLAAAPSAYAELTAKANHDHITIDFFYHGSTVGVKGTSDPGVDLAIKIASPDGHETLKQKGKVAGLLWMNTGTVEFDHAPNLYYMHSTKRLKQILSDAEMDGNVIGYEAMGRHVGIDPVADGNDKTRLFVEFVRYKESQMLYGESTGNIKTGMKDGRQEYHIKTDWPYQAKPGDYTVTVYAIKDGRVIEKAETPVKVEQVGIVKYLSTMAKSNGAIYGILSIAAALGAGFGVGMIFRGGGGAH